MTTTEEIFSYIMAAGFWVLALFFIKKGQHLFALMFGGLAFLAFLSVILLTGGKFKVQNNLSIEQILCWGFGLAFFVMSCVFVRKDHLAYAFVIFIICVFTCFCGLSGVQALLKTNLLWKVSSSLESYGDKIDNYQNTLADLEQKLSDQQAILKTNMANQFSTNYLLQSDLAALQKELHAQQQDLKVNMANQFRTNSSIQSGLVKLEERLANQQNDFKTNMASQFQTNSLIQSDLAVAQTKIIEQAQKLSDVNSLVEGLYKNMTNEIFTIKDTNNVQFLRLTNSAISYVIRLSEAPIRGSVEETYYDAGSKFPNVYYPKFYVKNLIVDSFYNYDTNSVVIIVHYVVDNREKTLYNKMPILNTNIIINADGKIHLDYPPN